MSNVWSNGAARWFGTGQSTLSDSYAAGAEAAAAAITGQAPRLLIVFGDVDYDHERLLAGICSQIADDVAVAGCTTNGQVGLGLPVDGSVVVAALGGPGFEATLAIGDAAGDGCREAGRDAAAGVGDLTKPHRLLLLLMDGLVGAQQDVVRGAYATIGARIPMVGGCAGDNLRWAQTYQFAGTGAGVEILSGCAVGVALGSDGPFGVGVAHGWRAAGDPMMVTSSSEGRVFELDSRPALEVYMERTAADPRLLEDPAAFRFFTLDRPLGLSRRGIEELRVIHGVEADAGCLTCLADVPAGGIVWVMESDTDGLVDGAEQACRAAMAALGDAPALGALTFDCGVRRVMLGDEERPREVERISESIDRLPFAGFYTFGEIARTNGARGMHHLTMVALALG